MTHILLYVMVLVGGLLFGVGLCINFHREGSSILAICLMLSGAGWVGGVVAGIEHSHRPVVIIRVVDQR